MMHRSTGFITLPLAYAAIAALVAIGGLGLWVKVEKARYERLKAEYEQFKGGVKALGEAAKKAAAEKEAQYKLRKEQADERHRVAVDGLTADLRRLRDDNARRRRLPQAGPVTASASGTCFDPARFTAAVRGLDESLLGIVEVGAKAVIDLDAAKAWGRSGSAIRAERMPVTEVPALPLSLSSPQAAAHDTSAR